MQREILLVVIVVFVIGITLPSSYSETEKPQNKICVDETISSGTFNSITVSDGSACEILNVRVLKNIISNDANGLVIAYSVIDGNLKVTNSDRHVIIVESNIGKNLKITDSQNLRVEIWGSTIGANLILKNNVDFWSDQGVRNNHIGKNMRLIDNSISNDFFITENSISKNALIQGSVHHDQIQIYDNVLGGNFKVLGNLFDEIAFETNSISGSLIIKNNMVDSNIYVDKNIIDKNLRILSNQVIAGIWLSDNQVTKNVNTSDNVMNQFFIQDNTSDSKIRVIGNTVGHFWGCQNNSPDPIMKKNILEGQPFNKCEIVNLP